jgi:hypothetical protein
MNKIIINFAIVSCFALGATFAHAAKDSGSKKSFNYYEAYDPHGVVQTGPGGVKGVIHPTHPIDSFTETGYADPNAPTPNPIETVDPGHRKTDGA